MKNFTLFLMLVFIPGVALRAQIVTGNAYIKGTLVEIGIDGSGGFEGVDQATSPPLPGMHARTAFLPFGFVANPQNNGWATYNGDFFTPGSPENGWGFEVGTASTSLASGSNNCGNFGGDEIPGALTNWAHTFNCYTADWEGNATTGTNLHFKVSYLLQETDLYYTTTVSITNNTTAIIPEMYYYRSLDPDNNEELSFDFTTMNKIVSQPGTGCNLAHVSATQAGGSGVDPSYLGLAAVGANWRAVYGGFSNRDGSDLWNVAGGGAYSPALDGTVNDSLFWDCAIALAYKINNLAPGATETFKFVTILNAANAANAINNLLYFSYPGSVGAPPAECTPYVDTVHTCGSQPVTLSVNGPISGDYNWSWSPSTGLSTTTGAVVVAAPPVTTTYTITGTPLTTCVPPVTMTLVVEIIPGTAGGGAAPVIVPVATTYCSSDPPFTLSADSTGGTWTGPGMSSSGTFTPSIAGAGTHNIIYTIGAGACVQSDTIQLTVVNSIGATITQPPPVCAGSAPITLTAASPGGVWTGTGITDSINGTFNPSVAGSYVITYTISGTGTCSSVDTVTVLVAATTTPVTGFSYPTSPVCIAGTNPTVASVPSFTTGGTYSSTPGLSINALTGTVNLAGSTAGTYTVTYTVPATTCGPAGTSTASIVITPLLPPVTSFSYITPVCNNDTMQVPVHPTTFTEGGTYSSSPGLTIDPVTGVVNIAASAAGTYTISYSVPMEADSCRAPGTGTATLVINPLPAILISQDVLMYIGETATLIADGGSGYAWTSNTNAPYTCVNSSCDTIKVSPEETTSYCVRVDTLGCIDSACVRVTIEIPCPSNRNLVVPNAFTPDGDGINDELCLNGWDDCVSSFQIMIFDRWGEKVFESKDPSFCWDGVFRGKPLDPAVFVYYIQASYKAEGATITAAKKIVDITKKGNISLVR